MKCLEINEVVIMKDEMKKKLHYELIERREKKFKGEQSIFAAAAVILIFTALIYMILGVNQIPRLVMATGPKEFVSILQNAVAFLFGAGILGSLSVLAGLAYVANQIWWGKKVEELEKLYSEVIE